MTLHRQVSIEAIRVCEFSSVRTILSTCDVLTQMSSYFMRHLWLAAHQSLMLEVITSTNQLEQSQFLYIICALEVWEVHMYVSLLIG